MDIPWNCTSSCKSLANANNITQIYDLQSTFAFFNCTEIKFKNDLVYVFNTTESQNADNEWNPSSLFWKLYPGEMISFFHDI